MNKKHNPLVLLLLIASSELTDAEQAGRPKEASPGLVRTSEVRAPENKSFTKENPIRVDLIRDDMSVTVYPNEDAKGTNGTIGKNPSWLVPEYPVVESSEIATAVDDLEKAIQKGVGADPSVAAGVFRIQFHLRFNNAELHSEIAKALTSKFREMEEAQGGDVSKARKVGAGLVQGLSPVAVRMCYAVLGDAQNTAQVQVLDVYPPALLLAQNDGASSDPALNVLVSLYGTPDALREFAKSPRVSAKYIVGSYKTTRAYIDVAFRDSIRSGFFQKLKGEDSMLNKVTIKTKAGGGGGGISFGPISFAGAASSNSSETKIELQRWVTRDHVLETFAKALESVSVRIVTEFGKESLSHLEEKAEQLTIMLLNRAAKKALEFKEVRDKALIYQDEQNRQVSVEIGKIDNIKIDTASALRLAEDEVKDVEAPIKGVPIKAHKEKRLKIDVNGENHASGLSAPIIPTTVDLYQISQALLDAVASESFEEIQSSSDKSVYDVAAIIRVQPKRFYDIGMIVCSMIPYEEHDKDFRHDWVPCDGRAVNGSKYEAIRLRHLTTIGRDEGWVLSEVAEQRELRPDGKPKADGRIIQAFIPRKMERVGDTICVPDLRGQFLRGLNEFSALTKDNVGGLRSDGRQEPLDPKDPAKPNADKVPARKAGDWQDEALKSHSHSAETSIGEDGTGKFTGGGGNSEPGEMRTNLFGGTETRPRNVGVYYYIKVN